MSTTVLCKIVFWKYYFILKIPNSIWFCILKILFRSIFLFYFQNTFKKYFNKSKILSQNTFSKYFCHNISPWCSFQVAVAFHRWYGDHEEPVPQLPQTLKYFWTSPELERFNKRQWSTGFKYTRLLHIYAGWSMWVEKDTAVSSWIGRSTVSGRHW